MTDSLTVQFSLSVDTLLNIIGGAMIVVTVVVFSDMGKIKYLYIVCLQSTSISSISSFVCQALLYSSLELSRDSEKRVNTYLSESKIRQF